MNRQLAEIIKAIDARFVSGNSVPVERAHIKRDEWIELHAALAHMKPIDYTITPAGRAALEGK
jgi:hypothetical protein